MVRTQIIKKTAKELKEASAHREVASEVVNKTSDQEELKVMILSYQMCQTK